MPYISQVAVGKRKQLSIFGNDYQTHDGTGVRDYIHIVDLAQGHIAALDKLTRTSDKRGYAIYNLGTGVGYSVLDMVNNFAKACGHDIPYAFVARREGDIATCYASTLKAEKELGWKTKKGLKEMCEDTWRWQKNNPNGFSALKSDL
jgi:UDP-glucose 4-epimerase